MLTLNISGIVTGRLHPFSGWWFVFFLWKIWVRQLGWWHPQYVETYNSCSKPPTRFFVLLKNPTRSPWFSWSTSRDTFRCFSAWDPPHSLRPADRPWNFGGESDEQWWSENGSRLRKTWKLLYSTKNVTECLHIIIYIIYVLLNYYSLYGKNVLQQFTLSYHVQ